MNHPDQEGRFDHIVTDIPYGIDLEMLNLINAQQRECLTRVALSKGGCAKANSINS